MKGQGSLDIFLGTTPTNNPCMAKGNHKTMLVKPKMHPRSLMKEGVSTLRYLPDSSCSIFKIIMPWRDELEEEERKKIKKLKQESEIKQQSLLKWMGKKKDR